MTIWFDAPEAQLIADRLIPRRHPDLNRPDVKVVVIFRDKAAKSSGRVVLGRARKISGLNAFLARRMLDGEDWLGRAFFVIEIAKDEWDDLSSSRQRALIDHELCHCKARVGDDNELKLGTRGHDVEEFVEIVERHGLWDDALVLLSKASDEHELGGDEDDDVDELDDVDGGDDE